DIALQLCSAGVLFAYGALALFLLAGSGIHLQRPRLKDLGAGAGLAALIGIPGLVLYLFAVHFGLSKEVIPTAVDTAWADDPALLLWFGANAFEEEVVVVMSLMAHLKHLRWSLPATNAASSLLRGSYDLD